MKKILLALLLFSGTAYAQTTYPSGVTGCIARWDFIGSGSSTNLPDVSNNNNGGVTYNLATANGFRRTGHAQHFNGLNSYAEVPNSVQLNPQQISIVALVKFTGFYSGFCQNNNIIYKSVSYYTPGCWAMIVHEQDYDNDCNVYSPNFEQMSFAGSSAAGSPVPAGSYIAPNQWYLLVTTYDGDSLKRYQIMMDSANIMPTIAPGSATRFGISLGSNNDNVFMGKTQNTTYPYYLNADVDEIALFNKALTAAEVQSVYNYLWSANLAVPGNQLLDAATVNMTNGSLRITNPAPGTALNISVYDMAGRRLTQQSTRDASTAIDLNNAAAGMFIVRLESGEATVVKKVSNL